jgi:hypothetical protein
LKSSELDRTMIAAADSGRELLATSAMLRERTIVITGRRRLPADAGRACADRTSNLGRSGIRLQLEREGKIGVACIPAKVYTFLCCRAGMTRRRGRRAKDGV